MTEALRTFAVAWLATQACSLIALEIGVRLADNRHLMRIGALAHRKKMRALERVWPLTRIRSAVERGDAGSCSVILSSLITLKSAASLAFGIVMIFWLPLASVMVPSIVALHDPDDPTLLSWVRRVATLQVTSHALAAALGFALVAAGPLAERPLAEVLRADVPLVVAASLASLLFALAAGRLEATGVVERGV